tara:strand:- start:93 stop:365 length:273 start_codon:yes stop_codon:yes gene_type:complete
MAKFEEPYKKGPSKKKDNQSDIKQSPMYKVGVERQMATDIAKSNLKGKEYVAQADSAVKEYKKGKEDLNAMKESLPMSNKTIEYYRNRYQ